MTTAILKYVTIYVASHHKLLLLDLVDTFVQQL